VPAGVDEAGVRRRLLDEHGIEIGGGLGELKGKVWRIGLMGETSRMNHVLLLLAALGRLLGRPAPVIGEAIEQAAVSAERTSAGAGQLAGADRAGTRGGADARR
jgi:alanine-glyoxylate transaminase/serine-glyoxylate transaminase/serine-pyruvate transaminase